VFVDCWWNSMNRLFGFQICWFERTWWRFFQKRVVRTKFDIYVFIIIEIVSNYGKMYWFMNVQHMYVVYRCPVKDYCILEWVSDACCLTPHGQYLFALLSVVCLGKKQQIQFIVWYDLGSNLRSTEIEASMVYVTTIWRSLCIWWHGVTLV
jgi:hypothetical protein